MKTWRIDMAVWLKVKEKTGAIYTADLKDADGTAIPGISSTTATVRTCSTPTTSRYTPQAGA